MINLHLYPSQLLNESRILREAMSISSFDVFESIELVGTGGEGLAREQGISDRIRIRRFGTAREDRGLIAKVLSALRWCFEVFRHYRGASVACVNCHSVATLPLGCLLKWSSGARLVYDAHELETETSGLGGIRKIGTKLVERALIKRADYCVFVGAAIDDWYRQSYGLENTAIIYNAPAFTTTDASDIFRELYPIAPDMPIFLYQGVLSEARAIPKLVEAFSTLEQIALVIMGYGDLSEWVEQMANQNDNIFYHPAVPPSDLLRHTAGADFGLSVIESTSLSYEYCMPNKLFEYLMAGKPVLVSPTREQRDFVERHGVGVVLEDTSVEAIRKGVDQLLSQDLPVLRERVNQVRKEFCWERQEQTLRDIYMGKLAFEARDPSA